MKYSKLLLFILVSLLNLYLNINRLNDISTEYYFWANLLFWLHLLPLFHYLTYRQNNDIFPFVGVLGIFLSLSFSIPIFFIHPTSYQLSTLSVFSLSVSFLGYLVFYLTYFSFQRIKAKSSNVFDPIKIDINNPKIRHVAYLFLSFWILDKFVSSTFIHHLSNLGIYVFIGTYLVLVNGKVKISSLERYVFYLILIFEYFTRLVDGLLAYVGMLTLFLIIIDFYTTKKIHRIIALIIPLVLAYVLISPVKSDFREKVWYSDVSIGIIGRLEILKDLISDYHEDGGVFDNRPQELVEREHFFWRYSYQASALSMVLEETPKNVPFWNGETYLILSKIVPRLFWPDKPKEEMGTKFGVKYGIIDIFSVTSMNTPIIAEMYINFGITGVIYGMMLLGILYVYLNSYFNNSKISNIGKVYSIAIIFPFVIHESNFSLVFGNVPLIVLTVYGIIKFYINK